MKLTSRVLIVGAFLLLAINLRAASEIVIAIRYLQAEHLHAPLDMRHHDYVRDIAARMSAAAMAA